MRKIGISAWLLLVAASPLLGQGVSCPAAKRLLRGMPQPKAAVRYLADDALEGRLAGSPGERCAGDYLAAEYRKLGLKPAGDSGTYFQSLSLASVVNPHGPTGTGRNIVGLLPGKTTSPVVVVGAHYDHLGHGPFGSLAPDDVGAIHHGADDNASGVAALLDVAARLAKGPRLPLSVVFVAFTGEEEGLLGSRYYALHPAVPLAQTRAMVNMDMVGRLGSGNLLVYGTGTADEWKGFLAAANRDSLKLNEIGDGYGASDHTSFYEKDVPVLHFFTNVHGDYHKPSDTWDKIDYRGIDRVAAMVAEVVDSAASRPGSLTLHRGVGAPSKSEAAASSGYGAYLGTVPDFSPVEKGVKLSSVRAGSPAEAAGLKGGDILIGFDDTEIKDLQGMTAGLRARKPGDSVRITVLRDGQPVTVTAVLGKR